MLTRPKLFLILPSLLLMAFFALPLGAKERISSTGASLVIRSPGQYESLQDEPKARESTPYRSDRILVKFKDKLSRAMIDSVQAGFNTASIRDFKAVRNLHLVRLTNELSVEKAIASYKTHPDVLYAEPDYQVKAFTMPNDPYFSSLWGLMNTGQNNGTPGADINASGAWDLTTGSKDVVVAVIDTGIDYTHPDLADNVWSNGPECTPNGIDDDGNGYLDDCHGINVVDRFLPPMDDYGHGTHVSGTIGALGNNGIGVAGINWNISVMACKFLDNTGSGYTSGAIECLDYVREMKSRGANIIATNNSWGGGDYSLALYEAIEAHGQAGILFIAAAGNLGYDDDVYPTYPASYFLPNVIAVAATDESDNVAFFSSDGRRSVHLGAPGVDIMSTTPDNGYETHSGTSMAAPHVTGVAALLKAQDPTRDWNAIRNIILSSGSTVPSLANTVSQKRLSAASALTCADRILLARLSPRPRAIRAAVRETVNLSVLHVNCALPNGEVTVTVQPGGDAITLKDDGNAPDIIKGDGIYTGRWIPSKEGIFLLNIPGEDALPVQVANKDPTQFRQAVVVSPSNAIANVVAVGDMDGDGRKDVVFASPGYSGDGYSYINVLRQDSSGNLVSSLRQATGAGVIASVAIGDVNNDGRNDLIIAQSGNDNDYFLGVFLQDGTGALQPMVKYATPNTLLVRVGDLNNDGLSDIACVGGASDTVQVFYQNRDGTLSLPVSFPVLTSGQALEIGDVNNDGLNDIVVGSASGTSKPSMGILYQGNNGTFRPPVYHDLRGRPDWGNAGVYGLAIGDMNGDGLKDVATTYYHGMFAGVSTQNSSGALERSSIYPSSHDVARAIKVGDVNSDGRNDMVIAGVWSLTVYLQNPTGSFFPYAAYPRYDPQYSDTGYYADGLALGDVNGDGLPDVVVADSTRGVVVYYGDPNGQSTTGTLNVQTSQDCLMGHHCGRGSVISNPSGINCEPDSTCAAVFPLGTRVRLTAIPDPDSSLTQWQGPCENDIGGGCTITVVPTNFNVAAIFDKKSMTVTVNKVGVNGATGTVISDLGGINCGSLCEATFPVSRRQVQLRAVPDPAYRLLSWGGYYDYVKVDDPTVCIVPLDIPRTIIATFGPPGLYVYPVGHGTITSDPPGINCTGVNDQFTTCSPGIFPAGSTVTLTATPSRDWQFGGWMAEGCLDTGPCKVVMNKDVVKVMATFGRATYMLSVSKSGTGDGLVTSSPRSIMCGTSCLVGLKPQQQMVLTAKASAGSMFAGWTGCPSASGSTCTVIMTSDISVAAIFNTAYTLTVTKSGMGGVTSTPPGIDCGAACSGSFAPDSTVTLNATPASGYAFAYWSGACSGASSTCNVLLASDTSAAAVFAPIKTREYRLTAIRRKIDRGNGTVTSLDGMIACGSAGGACTAMYYPHALVTLAASASQDSTFTGWSGACSGTDPCTVTMDKARSIIASFVGPQKLTIRKQSVRKGTGRVTSSSGGIDCATGCRSASVFYSLHQPVTLTATPDEGSTVTGWRPKSLNCSGTGCTVTMDRDLIVTAIFSKGGAKGEEIGDDEE